MNCHEYKMHLAELDSIPRNFRIPHPEVDPGHIIPQLGENVMPIKYEYLRVNKDDRVRITVIHTRTRLPFTAEGPVHSSYSKYVYAPGTKLQNIQSNKDIIGYQPAAIEMRDERTAGVRVPRYWKASDGGTVEKLIGDEYVQVYPIRFEGVIL